MKRTVRFRANDETFLFTGNVKFCLICEEVGTLVYGDTLTEAWQAFREDLALLLDEYARAEDDALSADARELKQRLNTAIRVRS